METFLTDYASRKALSKSYIRDSKAYARRFILPALGEKRVTEVKRSDVRKLHASMKERPYQANRVLPLPSKPACCRIGRRKT